MVGYMSCICIKPGTDEELDESFMRADADGNGEIEWAEFRDWYKMKNPDAVLKSKY